MNVLRTRNGFDEGKEAEYDLLSRGWLPYNLRWHVKVTETRSPYGYAVETTGDMVGIGVLTLVQDGEFVDVVVDWKAVVRKSLIRLLSSLARPLVTTNHRWAMSRGQMSIERELKLRAAQSDREREALAPPPGPMPAASVWATFGLVMLSLVLPGSILMWVLKRKSERAEP